MHRLTFSGSFVALLVFLSGIPSGIPRLTAQEPAVPATPRRPVIDAGTSLIPPRGADRIEAELEVAKRNARYADADKAAALERKAKGDAETEVKKREIATIEAKMKLAGKEKNEAQKAALSSDKAVAQRDRELLNRLADLAGAEAEVADKRAAFARAGQKALETELELARQRDARSRMTTSGPEAAKLDQSILDLARKVLEAQRNRADAEASLVDKERQFADRRIAVFRAETARIRK